MDGDAVVVIIVVVGGDGCCSGGGGGGGNCCCCCCCTAAFITAFISTITASGMLQLLSNSVCPSKLTWPLGVLMGKSCCQQQQ